MKTFLVLIVCLGLLSCKNGEQIKSETSTERTAEKVKDMSSDERDAIRKASNKGQVNENAQRLLWDLKERFDFGMNCGAKEDGHQQFHPKKKMIKKSKTL